MKEYTYNIEKVPDSYKEYYDLNQSNFNSRIDLELDEELYEFINKNSKENKININLYMNYVILKLVIAEKMKEEKSFDLGIPYFDVELYEEEEFSNLIENNKIIIFDEKSNKKAVIIPVNEYEKLQKYSKKNILNELSDEEYYKHLLENLENVQS
jgi:hypothetical protein